MPPLEKPFDTDSKLIDLVPHDKITCGTAGVYETIVKRRSRRNFKDQPLTLEEFSYLLLSTQGIKNPKRPFFRTSPSGGARHGIETYIYVEKVDALNPGLYRYLPVEHKLLYIGEKPKAQLTAALAGQDFNPAATFIWTVVPYRISWRYKGAEEKLALLDVGHVCQNLYTACEALHLVSVFLQPVLPERMSELWCRLGWRPPPAPAEWRPSPGFREEQNAHFRDALSWGGLQPGTGVVLGPPLFPREVGS